MKNLHSLIYAISRVFISISICASMVLVTVVPSSSASKTPAKKLFGAKKLPAAAPPKVHGFYTKGCVAGAVAVPKNGKTWQAMRLSRNRRWGHPDLVKLVLNLSEEAAKYDGWPGLLVGDLAQPRGGPMLSGHASHQVGLDADIWLTPMPNRRLSYKERENTSAISVLKKGTYFVDPNIWTKAHGNVIMRAAGKKEVQRIFVHPGIKKKLCETWKGDPNVLGKVRPYYGHHYHFHIRLHCPKSSPGCKSQAAVPSGSGCGKQLRYWFDVVFKPRKKIKKPKIIKKKTKKKKRKVRRQKTLADLPAACTNVLAYADPVSEEAVTFNQLSPNGVNTAFANVAAVSSAAKIGDPLAGFIAPENVPFPAQRPAFR